MSGKSWGILRWMISGNPVFTGLLNFGNIGGKSKGAKICQPILHVCNTCTYTKHNRGNVKKENLMSILDFSISFHSTVNCGILLESPQ